MTLIQLQQAADKAIVNHDHGNAIKLLSKIIAKDPKDAKAFYNRGVVYANL
jgi:Flp pilus assembly protein TadD